MKINIKSRIKQAAYALVGVVTAFAYMPMSVASAAQITDRSVTLGSSLPSADTTYSFLFTAAQATTIKSVSFAGCTTASGACTPATGFMDPNDSTLTSTSNLGSGGTWVVNTGTVGELRMSNTSNTGSPSAGITAVFGNVENPSTTGTYYMRITTYSADNFTGTIDTGTIAVSTATSVNVTASVDESLSFSIAGSPVTLGTLTTTSTGADTSTFTVGTNASSGYTVAYTGNTLTSGTDTITALSAGGGSVQGNSQFGINLRANTTPTIGSNVSGSGSGTASAGYSTIDSFKFNSGDTVASASSATDTNTFTVSYIANIAVNTPAGAYSTDINYVATANF